MKNLPANAGDMVLSLGQEDPLEEETATHPSIFAWEIPWTEEPGGLQSIGSQRIGYDLATKQQKQWGRYTYYHPHFTDEETEAQGD